MRQEKVGQTRQQYGRIPGFLTDPRFVFAVYVIVTIAASIGEIAKGVKGFDGHGYTHYNNFVIFRQSFFHLIHYQDLYKLYPEEHWDLYKYSPVFALFMGFFAWIGSWPGLILWNLLNALVLFTGIRFLPHLDVKPKMIMLWLVLIEMLTAVQNSQSNALIAGLIILAFNLSEKGKAALASLCISLTVFIKLFGIVGFVLFLFYPRKLQSILFSALWILILCILPLVVVSPVQLLFLYRSWLHLLQTDHGISTGLSIMGWLESWFGLYLPKSVIVLVGAVLFCLPLLRMQDFHLPVYRLMMLSSVLIWIVIFNHRAESPTFVIAMAGVVLWYTLHPSDVVAVSLITLSFVFTSLSPTDLFPVSLRHSLVEPYVLKSVPCIFIWFTISFELISGRFKKYELVKASKQ